MSKIQDWSDEKAALEKQKDFAYWERTQLIAALSKIFPAWLEKHSEDDEAWNTEWNKEFRTIVFIDFPDGQTCWHIHDSQVGYFIHLEMEEGNSWDGSDVEEKYKRIEKFSDFRDNTFVRSKIGKIILKDLRFIIRECEFVRRNFTQQLLASSGLDTIQKVIGKVSRTIQKFYQS